MGVPPFFVLYNSSLKSVNMSRILSSSYRSAPVLSFMLVILVRFLSIRMSEIFLKPLHSFNIFPSSSLFIILFIAFTYLRIILLRADLLFCATASLRLIPASPPCTAQCCFVASRVWWHIFCNFPEYEFYLLNFGINAIADNICC